MKAKNYSILLLTVMVSSVFLSLNIISLQQEDEGTEEALGIDQDASDALPTEVEDVSENLRASKISSDRIDFIYQDGISVDLPFNIDVWNWYVHANTELGVDWILDLPIDIHVDYPQYFKKGQGQDINIDMTIPENQAKFGINVTADFEIDWHVFGIEDGNYDPTPYLLYGEEMYFSTPIGKTNLPFQFKYDIPVSINGVNIGVITITATPQFISAIKAQILSNDQFLENIMLNWDQEDSKTIKMTARQDADSGDTIITIGNFEYKVAVGIEWAVAFKFVKPFDIINKFLDLIGFELKWVLGTFPKIDIGSLSSDETILLNTEILDKGQTGNSTEYSIGINANDWLNSPQQIDIPGPEPDVNNSIYYHFQALDGWNYVFDATSATSGVVTAEILDQSGTTLESTTTDSSAMIQFEASYDGIYYIKLTPEAAYPITVATVEFTNINWPGKAPTGDAIPISFSGSDDNTFNGKGTTLWYQFEGDYGDKVSFWCYEYNGTDNFDLRLYHESDTSNPIVTKNDVNKNPETLNFTINNSGTWYLRVDAANIEQNQGNFILESGLIPGTVDKGDSIDNPVEITTDYQSSGLGTEIDTNGGKWISTDCTEDYKYEFAFDGEQKGMYDYELYDSDKTTILSKGSFSGSKNTLNYYCTSTGTKYVHLLPYEGDFGYNITKSDSPVAYAGQDKEHALMVDDNFDIESEFPNKWASDQSWHQIEVEEGDTLLLKLSFEEANNYDLYLYDPSGSAILKSSTQNNPEVITYEVQSSGWYKVLVDRISGTGTYVLTTGKATPIDTEDIDAEFSQADINEYYVISLKEGEKLTIDLDFSGYRSDYVDLYVYDSNFEEVASDLDGSEKNIEFEAEEGGKYYIRIYNSEKGNGVYQGMISVPEEEETLNLLFLVFLIPACVGAVALGFVSYRYVQRKKEGTLSRKYRSAREKTGLKDKLVSAKDKISTGLKSIKESTVEKTSTLKSKISGKVDEIKDSPLRKVKKEGITPEFLSEEDISFEESFDEDLSDKELDFLKNVKKKDEDLF